MPREIETVRYFSAAEIARELNISRQTLWRWRKDGRIAAGKRFRDRQVFFTAAEFESIRAYANYLEPIQPQTDVNQLQLFGGGAVHRRGT